MCGVNEWIPMKICLFYRCYSTDEVVYRASSSTLDPLVKKPK